MKKKNTKSSSSVESPYPAHQSSALNKRRYEFGPFGAKGCAKRLKFQTTERGETSTRRREHVVSVKARATIGEGSSHGPAQAQIYFANEKTIESKSKTKARVKEVIVGKAVKEEPGDAVVPEKQPEMGPTVDKSKGKKPMAIMNVTVKSACPTDQGVQYSMTAACTFDFVYHNYAAKLDAKPRDIVIMKGRTVIPEDRTPAEVGVVHMDTLIVYPVGKSFNTDSRVKEVQLRECHNDPIKLYARVPLTDDISELYKIWGRFMQVSYLSFEFLKNGKKVKRHGSIESNGVKNGDKFYYVPDDYVDDSETF